MSAGHVLRGFLKSAKAADARPEAAKELAISLGGALDTVAVLRGFLNSSPPVLARAETAKEPRSWRGVARLSLRPFVAVSSIVRLLSIVLVLSSTLLGAGQTESGNAPQVPPKRNEWPQQLQHALDRESVGDFAGAERTLIASIHEAEQPTSDPAWLPTALDRLGASQLGSRTHSPSRTVLSSCSRSLADALRSQQPRPCNDAQ